MRREERQRAGECSFPQAVQPARREKLSTKAVKNRSAQSAFLGRNFALFPYLPLPHHLSGHSSRWHRSCEALKCVIVNIERSPGGLGLSLRTDRGRGLLLGQARPKSRPPILSDLLRKLHHGAVCGRIKGAGGRSGSPNSPRDRAAFAACLVRFPIFPAHRDRSHTA
jgi:hypothetical protein